MTSRPSPAATLNQAGDRPLDPAAPSAEPRRNSPGEQEPGVDTPTLVAALRRSAHQHLEQARRLRAATDHNPGS